MSKNMSGHLVRLRYAIVQQRVFLFSIFVALGLAMLLRWYAGNAWWTRTETIVNIATLMVGIVIWYTEAAENWEASLPKRLTAEFYLKTDSEAPRLIMVCRRAPLVGESDIRTWAFALGGEMNDGNRDLKYEPFFALLPPEIEQDENKQPFRHYLIRISLRELPKRLRDLERKEGRLHGVEWRQQNGDVLQTTWPVIEASSNKLGVALCQSTPTT